MKKDIHPRTPVRILRRGYAQRELDSEVSVGLAAAIAGMQPSYVKRAVGVKTDSVRLGDAISLLDLDAFAETFVPRSMVGEFLLRAGRNVPDGVGLDMGAKAHLLVKGDARRLIRKLLAESVNCVVTSTPYWGTRLYKDHFETEWADGERCAIGHEQTPEGFIRHSVEILYYLMAVLAGDGSVWWNLMDTYNTRTQIRGNAAETLRAMKGEDPRGWKDHECRRYSAGHSYLKDGEQCLIPSRVAERASRLGYWVKSMIYWKKEGSMPETVDSRVTREAETIVHLSLQRTPRMQKEAFLALPRRLGGRNAAAESEKITDVWVLSTAGGQHGHGAEFPVALPARCIALSTRRGDLVLDPFVGAGTTSVASALLGRRSIGFDVSASYLSTARKRLREAELEVGSKHELGRIGKPEGTNQASFGWDRHGRGDG